MAAPSPSAAVRIRAALRVGLDLSSGELAEIVGIPRSRVPVYIARLRQAGCEISNLAPFPEEAIYRLEYDPQVKSTRFCAWPGCAALLRRGNPGIYCGPHKRSADAAEAHSALEEIAI